jgi:hypothetical protein
MSTVKDNAKDKVDAAAKAVKKASDKAIDKSKDFDSSSRQGCGESGKAAAGGLDRLQS